MGATDIDRLIGRLQLVPYRLGGADWNGADCWGLVQLWYANRHGIDLQERGEIVAATDGITEGFDEANRNGWVPVDSPKTDDVIVARALSLTGIPLQYGHVAIFHDGHVLHSKPTTGAVYEPFPGSSVQRRLSAVMRHPDLI